VGWWQRAWHDFDGWFGFVPSEWMSASLMSVVIAAIATVPFGMASRKQSRAG
jgi:hypothetical protein